MKKYQVTIKEVNYGTVEIEADSEKEAREKATIEHSYGNVSWDRVSVIPTLVDEIN